MCVCVCYLVYIAFGIVVNNDSLMKITLYALQQLSLIHKSQHMQHNVQLYASRCTHLVYPWITTTIIKYDVSPSFFIYF